MSDMLLASAIGHLGHDPEVKTTPSGSRICRFSLGIGRTKRDTKITDWVDVILFDKQIDKVAQYLRKGSYVCIIGDLYTRGYVGRDGRDRFVMEILASRVVFLGKKPDEQPPSAAPSAESAPQDFSDDSIPF
jgi:single-strand DNA-binding protein